MRRNLPGFPAVSQVTWKDLACEFALGDHENMKQSETHPSSRPPSPLAEPLGRVQPPWAGRHTAPSAPSEECGVSHRPLDPRGRGSQVTACRTWNHLPLPAPEPSPGLCWSQPACPGCAEGTPVLTVACSPNRADTPPAASEMPPTKHVTWEELRSPSAGALRPRCAEIITNCTGHAQLNPCLPRVQPRPWVRATDSRVPPASSPVSLVLGAASRPVRHPAPGTPSPSGSPTGFCPPPCSGPRPPRRSHCLTPASPPQSTGHRGHGGFRRHSPHTALVPTLCGSQLHRVGNPASRSRPSGPQAVGPSPDSVLPPAGLLGGVVNLTTAVRAPAPRMAGKYRVLGPLDGTPFLPRLLPLPAPRPLSSLPTAWPSAAPAGPHWVPVWSPCGPR